MLELDGADGGGQIVRTALALSALSGEPFRMENVRGARPEPGLGPQHLAAVRAVGGLCDADVEGAETGSRTLAFRPGALEPGAVSVDVGTAGSVVLVCDAVLPLALATDGPLSVTVRGGTDVKWAPPLAYFERVKLPLLRRLGVHAAVDAVRLGFYPAGGGEATLRLAPSELAPLSLVEREDPRGVRVYSTASADLAEREVAERQSAAARETLVDRGIAAAEPGDADDPPSPDGRLPVLDCTTTYARTRSPGSALLVRLDYGDALAGFDALGERGKPAEDVGSEAAGAAAEFSTDRGSPAVDRHMADQLLPFLALAGGEVTVPAITGHVETCRGLLTAFGHGVRVVETDPPRLVADGGRA